jgi:predicted enzyme related to lactoylglutathione lyase
MAAGIVHFEIHVNDIERAKKFYSELFGWTFKDAGMQGMEYWLVSTGRVSGTDGATVGIDGGLMKRVSEQAEDGASPNAFPCTIGVEDVDDAYKKALELGAGSQMEVSEIPGVGRFAYLKDPEGNLFGILQSDSSAS